jgi:hypothetical protein
MITERHCQRCGLPLTDAASMEHGVGPICRKMDNAVLAQLIPADLATARTHLRAAMEDAFKIDEIKPTMERVVTALFDDENRDHRKTVKRIEWMLSFPLTPPCKHSLIEVARSLGYTTLALVWTFQRGVPGEAVVRIADGRIFVKGPRSKGAIALLRAVPGRKWHADEKEWSAPLAEIEKFALAVRTGYPNHKIDGTITDWATLISTAKKSATQPTGHAPPRKTLVRVKVFGGLMLVESPMNYAFVDALKELPRCDRRWSPGSKAWEVAAEHRMHVLAAAERCFGVPAEVIEA